jgi:hypothetical protein
MNELAIEERAQQYSKARKIKLDFARPLGSGIDGRVWPSNRDTAVKVFERQHNYLLERECYQRLQAAHVSKLREFAIPKLVDFDDDLLVVEMTIVSPPFLLDFGKVHLDRRPEFSAETVAEWRESMQELFEGHWPEVRLLLAALERYGIYYLDAKPGNIMFAPSP